MSFGDAAFEAGWIKAEARSSSYKTRETPTVGLTLEPLKPHIWSCYILSGLAFLPQPTPQGYWDLERTGGPFSLPLHSESLSVLGKILFPSGPRGPSSAPLTPAPYKGRGVWIRSLQDPCSSDPGGWQASVLSLPCCSIAVDQLSFLMWEHGWEGFPGRRLPLYPRDYPCTTPAPALPCVSSTGRVCRQPGADEFSAPAKL